MKWSKFALLALIFVFVSSFIFQSSQAKENSLKKGKWALQFEVGRNFDVRGFQGQTLSIKNHTADNRAFRLGITVALEVGDGETKRLDGGDGRRPSNTDFNSRRFDLNLQKIFYTDITAPVNAFYGIGAAVAFAHSKNTYARSYSYDTTTENSYQTSVSDSWSVGMSGIFGAEWFFAENMSLLGEYSTVINYGSETRKEEYRRVVNGTEIDSNSYEDKRNTVRISSSRVNLGLSFYF